MTQDRLLPLSYYQTQLIETLERPDTPPQLQDYNVLRWAVLLRPRADERRMRRGLDKLAQRHDSLRLQVTGATGEWKARIRPESPDLIVEELGDMDRPAMLDAVRARAGQPLSVFSEHLFEMRLLKFGKSGEVALVRIHHAICDAYSIVVIIEEFLKFMLNMPVLGKPVSHGEFVQQRTLDLDRHEARTTGFWNDHLLPVGPAPDIGRRHKGLAPLAPPDIRGTYALRDIVSRHESKQLAETAKRAGVTAYTLFFAAFADTLCQATGDTECLINAVIGRQNAALAGFVGAEMQLMTLKYRHQPDLPLKDKASYVSGLLQDGMEHMPTKAFYPGGTIDTALADNNRIRKQFLVHIPQAPGRVRNSPFAKALSAAMNSKLKVGFFEIERLDIDDRISTDFELDLSVLDTGGIMNATLKGNASGFDAGDLVQLTRRIRTNLGLSADEDGLEDRIFHRGQAR